MEGNPSEQIDKSAAVDVMTNPLSLYDWAACQGNYDAGRAQLFNPAVESVATWQKYFTNISN